jgi:tRNA (guanosine-2'-O-)-methyltransferase
MTPETKQELINYLNSFMSEKRQQRFREVLSHRTAHITLLLENLYQAHNASAVLRSSDCFGIQHVHFIENRNHLRISDDVAMGSSNWLTIHRHNQAENNTVSAIQELKKQGYRIVATSPHKNDYTLHELPVDKKFALVFGTEIDGISQDVINHADDFVRIPMFGFTESFNVSVSAALCMYELTTRIRQTVADYRLSVEEQTDVYLEWLKTSVDHSEALIRDFLHKKKI